MEPIREAREELEETFLSSDCSPGVLESDMAFDGELPDESVDDLLEQKHILTRTGKMDLIREVFF